MKRHRVCVIADRLNWCFARRAKALEKYAPPDFDVETYYYSHQPVESLAFAKYDLIFCLPTNIISSLRRLFTSAGIRQPLVASHNSGVGRRGEVLLESLLTADYTIVNNYGSWAHTRAIVRDDRYTACNISNGVDLTKFYSEVHISRRPHRVLWTSSAAKLEELDGNGRDIKGYQYVLKPLKILLENANQTLPPDVDPWEVDYLVVDQGAGLGLGNMRQWYNTGSYLVVASTAEGTPNIALEAAACGCVVVSTPVGNMPELIRNGRNGVLAGRNTRSLWRSLQTARHYRETLSRNMLEDIKEWDWSVRAPHFFALFRRIIAGDPPKPYTYLDLSPEDVERA